MTRKHCYIAALAAAAICAAACCILDHVHNFDIYDRFFEPLAVALLITSLWMLVAGVIWSRSGTRSNVVGIAVFNAVVPIILGLLLAAFGLDPNIHGSAGLLMLFGLLSLVTAITMILVTIFRRAGDAETR